jgi:two-component system OmpR family response regulator
MGDKPTILVVEDDEDCRSVLKDLLELHGYSVRTCQDAQHAVEAASAQRPALMLLDYLMPDADGAWVVRKLRESGIELPVVLTTGLREGREEAERLGLPSLEKPFDVSRLIELVRSLVPQA